MSTLDYGQKNRDTPEKLAKAAARKPSTELQKLAQKENFALFTLKGMKSQTHHLSSVPYLSIRSIETLRILMTEIEGTIRIAQLERKEKKNG